MQPTYYYPNKLSIEQDSPEVKDLYDSGSWRAKARRLQVRRWDKIHRIEEAKKSRLDKLRQQEWLQRHGWPRIAQPMV